jgi:hypothetical protein
MINWQAIQNLEKDDQALSIAQFRFLVKVFEKIKGRKPTTFLELSNFFSFKKEEKFINYDK